MKKMNFSVSINAPKEKVWNILWDADLIKNGQLLLQKGLML